jgi:hypothetical protein
MRDGLGVTGGQWPDDDQQQDVCGGQGAEARFDLRGDGEPGDDDRELAAGHEGAAGPPASRDSDPGSPGGPVACGDLGGGRDRGQDHGGEEDWRYLGRVGA